MNPIFTKAVPLLEKIENAGFQAYFVGGCVRDNMIGKAVSDVDIATSATPHEIKAIFPITVDVGIEHGTVLVIWENESYEVTTFRSEAEYKDFRRPSEVTFIRSLDEDLMRRDFTMNSMAMDKHGRIIDPYHGQEAIREKVIQTVGSPFDRFQEDALRMIRAVRFVSQLTFKIESHTLAAIKENASLLSKIAVERKTAEFEKLLKGTHCRKALQILLETDLYLYLPGLREHKTGLANMLSLPFNRLDSIEKWVVLLFSLGIKQEEALNFLKEWRLPVKNMKRIKAILHWVQWRHDSLWSSDALYGTELDEAIHAEKIVNILHHHHLEKSIEALKEQYSNLPIKDRSELAVTGNDLIEWEAQKGGKWVNEKLCLIEKAVLNGQVINQKEDIRMWLLSCK